MQINCKYALVTIIGIETMFWNGSYQVRTKSKIKMMFHFKFK
jgi:hypothetical protein